MLTRVREADGGGYDITVLCEANVIETRHESELEQAFAMQAAVRDTGKWPDGKEPGK